MNYGTPQEMIDEEREYYESIGEKPSESGCLPVVILAIIGIGMLIITSL
tara:strand:- start:1032 stop:1178 length:147 start_codon:yes stop_codon:yes gene_type:complete